MKEVKFLKSAFKKGDYPASSLPEVSFAGKSNVGKSSLINLLLGRKNIVKVSKTPGKTRLINFFKIDSKLVMVDLPGYGFAKVSLSERERWKQMVEDYLKERENLKALFLLIDSRRDISDDDIRLLEWLSLYSIKVFIVITKIDKISKNLLLRKRGELLETVSFYGIKDEDIFISSVKDKIGKKAIYNAINRYI